MSNLQQPESWKRNLNVYVCVVSLKGASYKQILLLKERGDVVLIP
jgi:hypothetical protein